MNEPLRSTAQRKSDTISRLETEKDIWVATASQNGRPHNVPFSLGWDGERVICATVATSVTARNLQASGWARLALGDTRDVVVMDVRVKLEAAAAVRAEIGEQFVQRTGWDPRTLSDEWLFLLMQPDRVQAWNNEPELEGRTIMRAGSWLI